MKNTWILDHRELAEGLVKTQTPGEFLHYYQLNAKRHWKGFSYAWLAGKMDVSKSLVVAVFQGKKKLSPKTLQGLLRTLALPHGLERYLEALVSERSARELEKLRILFLESLDLERDFDVFVSETDFPLLYAALGNQSVGATIPEIRARIDWEEERIRFVLNELMIKKFVTKTPVGRWKGTKLFLTTVAKYEKGWLPPYYRSSLKRHLAMAEKDFFSKEHLSLAMSFCIEKERFKSMNDEITKALQAIAQKYHEGEGDKIVTLVLGSHHC